MFWVSCCGKGPRRRLFRIGELSALSDLGKGHTLPFIEKGAVTPSATQLQASSSHRVKGSMWGIHEVRVPGLVLLLLSLSRIKTSRHKIDDDHNGP